MSKDIRDWQKVEIGERHLHFRKFLIQIAKKKEFQTKSSRVGKGSCMVEIYCEPDELTDVYKEATDKLREKQEKWKSRGVLPPEEATWQKIEFPEEEKEFRDLIVKRARSKRFRARTGNIDEGIFVEVLCHPEQMLQLKESAEDIIRDREWGSNLDNPNISLYKKLCANPLKTDEEVEQEQNDFLRNLVTALDDALELFKADRDEHYYDVNVAAKNLHREINNLTREGKLVIIDFKDGSSKYIRWSGERYNMLFFKTYGERYPLPYQVQATGSINMSELRTIYI